MSYRERKGDSEKGLMTTDSVGAVVSGSIFMWMNVSQSGGACGPALIYQFLKCRFYSLLVWQLLLGAYYIRTREDIPTY